MRYHVHGYLAGTSVNADITISINANSEKDAGDVAQCLDLSKLQITEIEPGEYPRDEKPSD